jgi:hypothetical protein
MYFTEGITAESGLALKPKTDIDRRSKISAFARGAGGQRHWDKASFSFAINVLATNDGRSAWEKVATARATALQKKEPPELV